MFAIALTTGLLAPASPSGAQSGIPETSGGAPERVIMLYIDGLHPEALTRYSLPHISRLRDRGTAAERAVMPFPAHPTVGHYGEWHTTSFPNVATLAGTAFLEERPRFLQHMFSDKGATLHAAGSTSYRSLNDGFDFTFTQSGARDSELIDFYIDRYEAEGDVVFARIMLQDTGTAGRVESGRNAVGSSWSQDIFAEDSPYEEALKTADAEIGRLLDFLGEKEELDDTLIILLGDGQSRHGWHLTLDADSETTPLIIAGPGVRQGHTISYAETIDIVPTVSHLMGTTPPNTDGGSGRILYSVLFSPREENPTRTERVAVDHPRLLERINSQIREYERLKAEATLRAFQEPAMNLLLMELDHELLSPSQFHGQDRLMEWSEAESLEAVAESNGAALAILRAALNEGRYYFEPDGPVPTRTELR